MAMGMVKAALGDMVVTFMWIMCASSLGALTAAISAAAGLQSLSWVPLLITIFLVFLLVVLFNFLGDVLGGASFNPTAVAAFYSAGLGPDSLLSMALRFPAQAVGAVGGVMALREVMPGEYKKMVGGPSLKVDAHTGAAAEAVLTFAITLAVLVIVVKGPRSPFLKNLLITLATVVMVISGSSFTGPSMNPVNAFGWAYALDNGHNTWDHFYVFWICPFIGAIFAAWFFRALFPRKVKPAHNKKKKA